ncbi:complex I 24 kDa subunit family protein [Desulfallas thermosapovorans]|uniref:NADP-reducing hydrogenase subunit HndA n=1 Tax=Desulfallas thermosapovorans DSM 6562 TaxID=1121431 RepID=A0A5S4ZR13_9FIRM|nr:NAD(P)H-dependent oxidoreductase subunit E [Desulfallas thermosapovorans]TYO95352.1 NADP-reducing hydrogenase subunit HndA [Desulfallas thermosapovorans DSM 6562]
MQEKHLNCGNKARLTGDIEGMVEKIINKHQDKPDGLYLVLQDVQDLLGTISEAVLHQIAGSFGLQPKDVSGMINYFPLIKPAPPAKYKISVCLGTNCYLHGSARLLERLSQELALEPGETSPDGKFSLEVVRCLGSCALSPVIMINDVIYPRVELDKIAEILNSCE